MNQKQQGMVLAGLLALALAGCSSTRSSSDDMAASSMGSTTGASRTGSTGSTPSSATAATGAADSSMASPTQAQTQTQAGSTMMPAGPPNAVVVAIDTIPRASAAGADSSVGGSGGTTGSSTGSDKMYRITLRMDDGSTRVVTQDKAPTFSNGDRVNMMDGMISR
ncbi:MAG: hypothetical protein QFF03_21535 [Pseudomonadota bacterium]|nr:hypothetical protein [Pseudomonadota bacterium]